MVLEKKNIQTKVQAIRILGWTVSLNLLRSI